MNIKKINLPLRDSSGENRELTIYYGIELRDLAYKSSKCFYCREKHLGDVATDTLIVHEVYHGNVKYENREQIYNLALKSLKKLLGIKKRRYCKKEKCMDMHFDFINKIDDLVEN